MGIGFVIIIHLVAIFVFSAFLAVIGAFICYFAAKNKRNRKVLLAIISPFIALYTLYFTAVAGAIGVSEYKGIDVGIGDVWYVPLPNNYRLTFIDSPEQAYIECDGRTIIADVSEIALDDDKIYVKTYDGEYRTLNTEYKETDDSRMEEASNKIAFKKASDFYTARRSMVAGTSLSIVGILSLLVSIAVTYGISRLVLKK